MFNSHNQQQVDDYKFQLETAQRELDDLRAKHPEWQDEINKIVQGFNSDGPEATEQAFEDLDHLIGQSRVALNHAEASSKVARANLLYSFNVAKAAPLLCAAAHLVGDNFNYWIHCGRAQVKLGQLSKAQKAFETAKVVAKNENPQGRDYSVALNDLGNMHVAQGDRPTALNAYEEGLGIHRTLTQRGPRNSEWQRDLSVSLSKIGDVHVAQGDRPAALEAYEEGLGIARALSQQDPSNAEWQRDLAVSYAKMAMIDAENAQSHWTKVVEIFSDMQARGVLLPGDVQPLNYARNQLGAD